MEIEDSKLERGDISIDPVELHRIGGDYHEQIYAKKKRNRYTSRSI